MQIVQLTEKIVREKNITTFYEVSEKGCKQVQIKILKSKLKTVEGDDFVFLRYVLYFKDKEIADFFQTLLRNRVDAINNYGSIVKVINILKDNQDLALKLLTD